MVKAYIGVVLRLHAVARKEFTTRTSEGLGLLLDSDARKVVSVTFGEDGLHAVLASFGYDRHGPPVYLSFRVAEDCIVVRTLQVDPRTPKTIRFALLSVITDDCVREQKELREVRMSCEICSETDVGARTRAKVGS